MVPCPFSFPKYPCELHCFLPKVDKNILCDTAAVFCISDDMRMRYSISGRDNNLLLPFANKGTATTQRTMY